MQYRYKALVMLQSSYFYWQVPDEFKSTNVDKILANHAGKKADNIYLPHFAESEAET